MNTGFKPHEVAAFLAEDLSSRGYEAYTRFKRGNKVYVKRKTDKWDYELKVLPDAIEIRKPTESSHHFTTSIHPFNLADPNCFDDLHSRLKELMEES